MSVTRKICGMNIWCDSGTRRWWNGSGCSLGDGSKSLWCLSKNASGSVFTRQFPSVDPLEVRGGFSLNEICNMDRNHGRSTRTLEPPTYSRSDCAILVRILMVISDVGFAGRAAYLSHQTIFIVIVLVTVTETDPLLPNFLNSQPRCWEAQFFSSLSWRAGAFLISAQNNIPVSHCFGPEATRPTSAFVLVFLSHSLRLLPESAVTARTARDIKSYRTTSCIVRGILYQFWAFWTRGVALYKRAKLDWLLTTMYHVTGSYASLI